MLKNSILIIASIVLLLSTGSTPIKEQPGSDLVSGFLNPPPDSRPHTFWIWMNGNVTREGITADLEAMERVGIGGVMLFNVAGSHGTEIPDGPVEYMSEEWFDLIEFTTSEAERLGLEVSLHNCAGWATTGGPWVTPEYGMMQLVTAEITLWGNRHISKMMPHPEVFEGFYRDIAVYAVPKDKDSGYRVHQWGPKTGQQGGRFGRQPDFSQVPENAAIPANDIIDVTEYMNEEGVLEWDAPPGVWNFLRLGYTARGNTNNPTPEAGRGLEIDKLRRETLDLHWKEGIEPVLERIEPFLGKSFSTIHLDSYEAGLHHWTPRMMEKFQKRRGYDPTPYLLALTGRLIENPETTERFLWDFRRTISDLFIDNYYGYYADLCHERGLKFLTEPYTSCFEGLAAAAKTDYPTAEFWADGGYSFSLRLAASLAHINDRKFASAEAFTGAPHLARWENHPGLLKRVCDWAWSEGINRYILHSYPHQPWKDVVPGMTMGQYGCHFDRNNTWWEPGKAWIDYIRRSQFLLQAGENVADVLIYAGDAAPNLAVNRPDIKAAGYDYDACGTDIILQLEVDDGDIVLPTGKRYRILVLPETEFMRPVFARKILELVRSGATVLGPKPKHTPSLENFPSSEKEVISIGNEVWGNCDGKNVKSNKFGKGQVFYGVTIKEVMWELKIPPQLKIRMNDGIAWIHRSTEDAEIYFLSNQTPLQHQISPRFRTLGKQPEIWSAVDGSMKEVPVWSADNFYSFVPLTLMPNESIFVVFRKEGNPPDFKYAGVMGPAPKLTGWPWFNEFVVYNEKTVLKAWENGKYLLSGNSGKMKEMDISGLPDPYILDELWKVQFQQGRGAPEAVVFENLVSWDEHLDPGIKYFSGTATYQTQFYLPQGFIAEDQEVWLDLGDVEVIASVRLNGKEIDTLWTRPFRVEISEEVRAGLNELEVEVTNLWVNRLIGDEQFPQDVEWEFDRYLAKWPDWFVNEEPRPEPSRVTFTTWKHWDKDDQTLPSGLLGPVQVRCAKLVELE